VQLGQENTWGTSVAATAILMGVTDSTFSVEDETYQPEQQGNLYPSSMIHQVKQWAEGEIELDLTYEDILYLLDGVFGDCTPSGTDPYTWDYSAPTNATVAPREYTVEFGMDGAEYKVEGAIFNDFEIEGDLDGDAVWKGTINLLGKAVATTTMASLSERTVELITMADTTLYIDTAGGTIGSTEVSDSLISFTLSVEPGYHLKHFNDLNPTNFGYDRWVGELEMMFEYTADVKAYVDAMLGGSAVERQVRLKATSGTKVAQIDFAGYIVDGVELFDDRDGNTTVALTFQGEYNSQLANWLKFQIVNGVDSLT